jgi:hypothetical protein
MTPRQRAAALLALRRRRARDHRPAPTANRLPDQRKGEAAGTQSWYFRRPQHGPQGSPGRC